MICDPDSFQDNMTMTDFEDFARKPNLENTTKSTTTPNITTTSVKPELFPDGNSIPQIWVIIGGVIGALLMLLIIAVSYIIYIKCKGRRRRRYHKRLDSSTTSSPFKRNDTDRYSTGPSLNSAKSVKKNHVETKLYESLTNLNELSVQNDSKQADGSPDGKSQPSPIDTKDVNEKPEPPPISTLPSRKFTTLQNDKAYKGNSVPKKFHTLSPTSNIANEPFLRNIRPDGEIHSLTRRPRSRMPLPHEFRTGELNVVNVVTLPRNEPVKKPLPPLPVVCDDKSLTHSKPRGINGSNINLNRRPKVPVPPPNRREEVLSPTFPRHIKNPLMSLTSDERREATSTTFSRHIRSPVLHPLNKNATGVTVSPPLQIQNELAQILKKRQGNVMPASPMSTNYEHAEKLRLRQERMSPLTKPKPLSCKPRLPTPSSSFESHPDHGDTSSDEEWQSEELKPYNLYNV